MDASKHIDQKIASLTDWRGDVMRKIRALVLSVDADIVEEWKWMGTATWNKAGILCVANAHKEHVKVTFGKGAKLADPRKVFNAGLDGGTWRSIDLHEGDKLDAVGFKGLVRAAIAVNEAKPAKRKPDAKTSVSARKRK
jgi:hypothetical protein